MDSFAAPADRSIPKGPLPRVNKPDRSQVDLNPKVIDALIPDDHPARLVWELVQGLDFTPLYARIKAVEGHPGRPAIDPPILAALWTYATSEGVSSAHQLEELCHHHDAFKWLRGGVAVNYHTLSDFHTDHADWLQEQVVYGVAVLRAEGLVDLNQVGHDGVRVRASAGASSFKKEATLDKYLQEAQQQWDRLQKELQAGKEDVSARQRAARERAARERLERLQKAKGELQKMQAAREARQKGDGESARASVTDPEARRMKMADGGYRPAYNVQFSTTLDTLVVVGVDVTNAGTDAGQMGPMVEQIERDQGEPPKEYFSDGGFSTHNDIKQVEQRGVTVYTPVKEAERQEQEGKDPYAPRPGDSPEVAAWRQRMGTKEGKAKYRLRAICEWTNAMGRNRGLQQFFVRGLAKVKAVALWFALVQNLLQLVALRAAATA